MSHTNEKKLFPTGEKAALLLIEYQREWLDADGKINRLMEDKKQLADAVANSERLVAAARAAGLQIVHSGLAFQDGHPELGNTTFGLRGAIAKFQTFPASGKGSQFVEPFVPYPGEFVARGRTGASAFAGSNLDSFLRNNCIHNLYIAGFALHVCVESTLRHGHDLGYDIILVEDASAAFNQAQRKHVLEDVVHHYGEAATVDEFIKNYQDK